MLSLLIKHDSSRLIKIICLFARIKFKIDLIKYMKLITLILMLFEKIKILKHTTK